MPSVSETGDFPLIMIQAVWQIFDQSEQTDILKWVKSVTSQTKSDPAWIDWTSYAPNGYAL